MAVSTSYPLSPTDGTAPFVRSISHEISRLGIQVDVVLPWHPQLSWEGKDGAVGVHTYSYLPRFIRGEAVWGYGLSLESDRALRVSALLTAPMAVIDAIWRILRLVRRKTTDLIHAHWLIPNGFIAAIAAAITKVPFAVSVHGSDVYLAERNAVLAAMARWIARRATSITVCSSDLKERLTRLGVSPRKMTVVPYGVDIEFFAPDSSNREFWRREVGVPEEAVVVGAVGRLVAKKGFDVLIRAIGLLPDNVHLVIAGDGSDRKSLEVLIKRLRIGQRVHFLGAAERRAVRDLYRSVDVVAVPSVIDASGNVDGLPNVVLEALSSGCVVVASEIAGIPDVIEDGSNGLLVEPGSPHGLADALLDIAEKDPLQRQIGDRARATAISSLTWRSVVERSPYLFDIRKQNESRMHSR